MIFRKLDFCLSAQECITWGTKLLEKIDQIAKPKLRFEDNLILLDGIFNAGLPVPFQTSWILGFYNNNRLELELASFKAGPFGGTAIGERVVSMLAEKLGQHVTVETDCCKLKLPIGPVLARHGVEISGEIKTLRVTSAGLEITIS